MGCGSLWTPKQVVGMDTVRSPLPGLGQGSLNQITLWRGLEGGEVDHIIREVDKTGRVQVSTALLLFNDQP